MSHSQHVHPFTAPSCRISRLKSAHMHACWQYLDGPILSVVCSSIEVLSHALAKWRKITLMISHWAFTGCFPSDGVANMVLKGLITSSEICVTSNSWRVALFCVLAGAKNIPSTWCSVCVCVCVCVCACVKLQALVYDLLPSTTAVFSYAIGHRKLSANKHFFCWCSKSSKFVTNNSNYFRRLFHIRCLFYNWLILLK